MDPRISAFFCNILGHPCDSSRSEENDLCIGGGGGGGSGGSRDFGNTSSQKKKEK